MTVMAGRHGAGAYILFTHTWQKETSKLTLSDTLPPASHTSSKKATSPPTSHTSANKPHLFQEGHTSKKATLPPNPSLYVFFLLASSLTDWFIL